jgi:hypothetical protein
MYINLLLFQIYPIKSVTEPTCKFFDLHTQDNMIELFFDVLYAYVIPHKLLNVSLVVLNKKPFTTLVSMCVLQIIIIFCDATAISGLDRFSDRRTRNSCPYCASFKITKSPGHEHGAHSQ